MRVAAHPDVSFTDTRGLPPRAVPLIIQAIIRHGRLDGQRRRGPSETVEPNEMRS